MIFVLSMNERCDQIVHCLDESDEDNCDLIVFKGKYKKKVPPFNTTVNPPIPVPVEISTSLRNVLEISESSHTITLKFGITLKWYENRVNYNNLKSAAALNLLSEQEVLYLYYLHDLIFSHYSQVNSLWIPYIIFSNTDNDDAVKIDSTETDVSITRQGNFTRSGPEIVDEVWRTPFHTSNTQ